MSAQPKTELAERPTSNVVMAGATMMDVIARAAADPNTDVDKLERLLAMAERIKAQEAKAAYTRDLATMQPKLPVIDEKGGIKNNAGVVQSTYAKWEDINDAIQPILSAHGFALSFRPGIATDGKVTVTTVLAHADGHSDEATVTLPHDASGSKNSVQAVGSSFTYAKRYGAIGLLNITSRAPGDRDDDGQTGGLGGAAQHAVSQINMAEDVDALRAWKRDHYEPVSKLVSQHDLGEIIALYNRRLKALRAGEASQ